MTLEWQKEFNSGIPALDFQHQIIFETIGSFFKEFEAGANPEELEDIFASLDVYAQKHFSYEENLQQINHFPGLKSQQDHHMLFLSEMKELKRMLKADELRQKQLAVALKGRLMYWWILHIKDMDQEFVEFLNENGRGADLAQA